MFLVLKHAHALLKHAFPILSHTHAYDAGAVQGAAGTARALCGDAQRRARLQRRRGGRRLCAAPLPLLPGGVNQDM